MNTTTCRACKAEIIFLRKPRKDGTVGVHPTDASSVQIGDEAFDPERHVSHFDTCPDAWRFRSHPPVAAPKAPKTDKSRPAVQPAQLDLFTMGGGR